MNRKGFTLIELLVVIAIIGLLSSLAVVSLNSARKKAYNAQIKSDLSQVRNYAAVNFENGDFTTLDLADVTPTITPPACSDASYTLVMNAGFTEWAAYASLCVDEGTGTLFCVDSTGNAKLGSVAPTAASPVCP